MKSSLLLILLLLIPIVAIADTSKSQLIGHWRYADENVSCDIRFRDDGSFTGNIAHDGKVTREFAGKWSLAGDILSYDYTLSALDNGFLSTTDRDKLVEITKEYYMIESRDGSRRKYVRVDDRS